MQIRKTTKSILVELFDQSNDLGLNVFETRAEHVLSSVFGLYEMIDGLDIDESSKEDLRKRLLLSIRNKDQDKLLKAVRLLKRKKK
jgi:4-diphosphocytidyl-2C-methyl-D-erythritol kinase